MPQPIPLRRTPPHLAPPPACPTETTEARRNRQLALTRELTDLNMLAARDAAHRIATRDPDPAADATPAAHDPTLALARATRATLSVIALENRIAAGEHAKPFTVEDPRAHALRSLLDPLIAREPDPARRRALRLGVAGRIDDALAADLDDDIALAQVAHVIALEFGLPLELNQIPDQHLIPPAHAADYHRPNEHPEHPPPHKRE